MAILQVVGSGGPELKMPAMANLMQEPGAASEWIARTAILIVPGKKTVADKPKMSRPLSCLLLQRERLQSYNWQAGGFSAPGPL